MNENQVCPKCCKPKRSRSVMCWACHIAARTGFTREATEQVIARMIADGVSPSHAHARDLYGWRGNRNAFFEWRDRWAGREGVIRPSRQGQGGYQEGVALSIIDPNEIQQATYACRAAAIAALQPKAPEPEQPDRADCVSDYFRVWRRLRRCVTVNQSLAN